MHSKKIYLINGELLFEQIGALGKSVLNKKYDLHVVESESTFSDGLVVAFLNSQSADNFSKILKNKNKAKIIIVYQNEFSKELAEKLRTKEIIQENIWSIIESGAIDPFNLKTLGPLEKIIDAYFAREELEHYSGVLNQVLATTLAELHRARHIHEKIVPVRKQSFKNLEILSKYGAGDAPGGEFFDMAISENAFAYVHFSSNSYVLNSKILTAFEVWRPNFMGSLANLESLLGALSSEAQPFQNKSKDKRPALELCLLHINAKTLEVSGWVFGNFNIVLDSGLVFDKREYPVLPPFFDQGKISFKLERSGKLLILSPGIQYNSGGFLNKQPVLKFALDWVKSSALKCINEIFFQIKKNDTNDFFNFDLTTTIIEVNSNAIIKV